MSQNKKSLILSHIKRGWWINPRQCIEKYGCMTLSQRIGDLREEGWPIEKDWLVTDSGARVRKYRLARNWREVMAA